MSIPLKYSTTTQNYSPKTKMCIKKCSPDAKLCCSGDEHIMHEQFYVVKLKHIFIFKCQELTVKCFKCTVREWKSRSEIKWKWIKRSAEWKHFKTWHQNCPWVIAVIRACVWVQEEEHPVWEHCSYTSKLNQAWIIQTFSPISLSVCLSIISPTCCEGGRNLPPGWGGKG